jgi:hypothetical protein
VVEKEEMLAAVDAVTVAAVDVVVDADRTTLDPLVLQRKVFALHLVQMSSTTVRRTLPNRSKVLCSESSETKLWEQFRRKTPDQERPIVTSAKKETDRNVGKKETDRNVGKKTDRNVGRAGKNERNLGKSATTKKEPKRGKEPRLVPPERGRHHRSVLEKWESPVV